MRSDDVRPGLLLRLSALGAALGALLVVLSATLELGRAHGFTVEILPNLDNQIPLVTCTPTSCHHLSFPECRGYNLRYLCCTLDLQGLTGTSRNKLWKWFFAA